MKTTELSRPEWTVMLSGELVRVLTFATFKEAKNAVREFRRAEMMGPGVCGNYMVIDSDGDVILDSQFIGQAYGYNSDVLRLPSPGVYKFDSENDAYVPFHCDQKGSDRLAV